MYRSTDEEAIPKYLYDLNSERERDDDRSDGGYGRIREARCVKRSTV